MIVQLEVVEYRDLEAGMSLVVFEEKTARAIGAGCVVRGRWEIGRGGQVGKADRNQVTLQASILDGKRKHWCLYTKSSPVVTSEDLFSLCPRQRGKSELRACGERFSSRELGMQVLIILVI